MANTGVVDGSDILLFIDVSGTLTPIAHLQSQDFASQMDTKERSSKDTGVFKNKRAGKIGQSINFDGLMTYDDFDFWDLYALHIAQTEVTIKYGGHSDATREGVQEAAGDKYFSAKALISSVKRSDPNEDDAKVSGTLEITELPTVETVSV